jgi:hypothetical protein
LGIILKKTSLKQKTFWRKKEWKGKGKRCPLEISQRKNENSFSRILADNILKDKKMRDTSLHSSPSLHPPCQLLKKLQSDTLTKNGYLGQEIWKPTQSSKPVNQMHDVCDFLIHKTTIKENWRKDKNLSQ